MSMYSVSANTLPPGHPNKSREDFINCLRHVAAGVYVITTHGKTGELGATVSSFCSVSADPPTVLICLRAESRIAKAVTANSKFTVNIISQGDESIARRFAGMNDLEVDNRFSGLEYQIDPVYGPKLGKTGWLDCDVLSTEKQATHLIVIARVTKTFSQQQPAIAWMNGQFHCLKTYEQVSIND